MPEHILQPDQIWLAILGELRLQLPKSTYDIWLRDSVLLSHTADTNEFVIGVYNANTQDWLESRLRSTLQRTLTGISGRPATVRIEVVAAEEDSDNNPQADTPETLTQKWLAAGIPDKFLDASFETLDWSQPALQKPELHEYVAQALDYFQAGVGLTLIGPTGIGKTHLAVGLLKKAIAVHWSARFIGTVSLLDEIRATFDASRQGTTYQTEHTLIHKLAAVRLLVLDDLRLDGLTAWGRDRLYAVLNPRWERGLPTITTSNYTPNELSRSTGRERLGLDEGTLSRLVRTALTLQLDGTDYRSEQKQRAIAHLTQRPQEHLDTGQ